MAEQTNIQQYDNENMVIKKDNRELLADRHKFIAHFILIEQIAHIAPLISLARFGDIGDVSGLNTKTVVRDVEIMIEKASTLLRFSFHSEIASNKNNKSEETTLLIFRGVSGLVFEPFVCIIQDEARQLVFAYADDQEFIINTIEGNDHEILHEICSIAQEKRMPNLQRFASLMIKIIQKQAHL